MFKGHKRILFSVSKPQHRLWAQETSSQALPQVQMCLQSKWFLNAGNSTLDVSEAAAPQQDERRPRGSASGGSSRHQPGCPCPARNRSRQPGQHHLGKHGHSLWHWQQHCIHLPSNAFCSISLKLCPCEKQGFWNKLYCRVLSKPRRLLRLSTSPLWDKSKKNCMHRYPQGNKWEFSPWNAQRKLSIWIYWLEINAIF